MNMMKNMMKKQLRCNYLTYATYYGDEMMMRPVTLTMMIQVVKLHTCIQYILIPAE